MSQLLGQQGLDFSNHYGSVVGESNGLATAAGQIFDLALPGGKLVDAEYEGDAKATAVGVLELLAQLFRLRIEFNTDAGCTKPSCQSQVVVAVLAGKERDEYGSRRRRNVEAAKLLQGSQ